MEMGINLRPGSQAGGRTSVGAREVVVFSLPDTDICEPHSKNYQGDRKGPHPTSPPLPPLP